MKKRNKRNKSNKSNVKEFIVVDIITEFINYLFRIAFK